jgi:hypothetical protein
MIRSVFILVAVCCFNCSFSQVRSNYEVNDTIQWEVPELQAKGALLFDELDPVTKMRLRFSSEKKVSLVLTSGVTNISFHSPSTLEISQHNVDVNRNGVKKTIQVNFLPPFKPSFSTLYKKQTGAIYIENSATYELVNIAFALTEKGGADGGTFYLNTPYFQEVAEYFKDARSHPLIQMLNKVYAPGSSEYRMYRESAYNYSLRNGKIEVTGPYHNFEEGNSIMEAKELWEDFVSKTNFTAFYKQHEKLYAQQISEAKQLLPIKQMWTWCERKFPNRYHTYRVVISPMVNGFHSTQHITSDDFSECVMFLCDAHQLVNNRSRIEAEVSYSGLLFTEIDHNYINPLSDKFKNELNKVFEQDGWITAGSQAAGYGSGVGYFNEYMTHAVFLLYVEDHYPASALTKAIDERTELMTWRGFPRFRLFYDELRRIIRADKTKAADLSLVHPDVIQWAAQVKND